MSPTLFCIMQMSPTLFCTILWSMNREGWARILGWRGAGLEYQGPGPCHLSTSLWKVWFCKLYKGAANNFFKNESMSLVEIRVSLVAILFFRFSGNTKTHKPPYTYPWQWLSSLQKVLRGPRTAHHYPSQFRNKNGTFLYFFKKLLTKLLNKRNICKLNKAKWLILICLYNSFVNTFVNAQHINFRNLFKFNHLFLTLYHL